MITGDMEKYWADGARGWVEHEAIFDRAFAPLTAEILDTAAMSASQRVLDVGCGTGTLLHAGVAAGATMVGVDIAPGMAEAARRRVPEATVVVADAQSADLRELAPGDAFDLVVSRFGVMFFADPVAAFGNIRGAAAPDARLVFGCWRDAAENPMFSLGSSVLADRLPPQPTPPPEAPGPTAFADRDRLESILARAGWTGVDIRPFDFSCDYRAADSDGVEERLATILSTSTGRRAHAELAPELGQDGWAALLDDVREELRRNRVDGGLQFPAAVWLVTAG
ncbi:class I SAM-dependent methyltransferase [Microlunatus sp. Y2014]|uniref:class I SAM-dependent methyltransferase n=1 Tax=Microlunatus sp. Y2014 TaxID=3418488 RepID=UPI003DA729B8